MAKKHEVVGKVENGIKLEANYQPSGGNTWMARISGTHPKYGLDREFVSENRKERSSSGKTGTNEYIAKEGEIYEMNVAWGDRFFFAVEEGDIKYLDGKEEALEKIRGES